MSSIGENRIKQDLTRNYPLVKIKLKPASSYPSAVFTNQDYQSNA